MICCVRMLSGLCGYWVFLIFFFNICEMVVLYVSKFLWNFGNMIFLEIVLIWWLVWLICCSFEVIEGGVLIWMIKLMEFMLILSFNDDVVIIVGSLFSLSFFLIIICVFLVIELWWVVVSFLLVILLMEVVSCFVSFWLFMKIIVVWWLWMCLMSCCWIVG